MVCEHEYMNMVPPTYRSFDAYDDNSKCIRTSEGGRGVKFLFPPWGWYGCFLE